MTVGRQWRGADGGWRVTDVGWRGADGGWRVTDGSGVEQTAVGGEPTVVEWNRRRLDGNGWQWRGTDGG